MDPLTSLDHRQREELAYITVAKANVFFDRYRSNGGNIHAGFSNLFGALGLFQHDIILLVNQAITPFNETVLPEPKNDLWGEYTAICDGSSDSREKERAYIRAHNRDLDGILETTEPLLDSSQPIAKAYYTALVDAAHELEDNLKRGMQLNDAFSHAAVTGFNAFVSYGISPIPIGKAGVFGDAIHIGFVEAARGRMGREEIYVLETVRYLSRLSDVVEEELFLNIRKNCGLQPTVKQRILAKVLSLLR